MLSWVSMEIDDMGFNIQTSCSILYDASFLGTDWDFIRDLPRESSVSTFNESLLTLRKNATGHYSQ